MDVDYLSDEGPEPVPVLYDSSKHEEICILKDLIEYMREEESIVFDIVNDFDKFANTYYDLWEATFETSEAFKEKIAELRERYHLQVRCQVILEQAYDRKIFRLSTHIWGEEEGSEYSYTDDSNEEPEDGDDDDDEQDNDEQEVDDEQYTNTMREFCSMVERKVSQVSRRKEADSSSKESESSIVQNLSRHKGPVCGLEFSSLSPNHLASGAEEGEVSIWHIAKPAKATHFPPLKGSGYATQGVISIVSCNKKVQLILSLISVMVTTVVWDPRKQKPAISFSDSVKRQCSVLQWHPDFATQLVASDNDSPPSLRIWDMRNTISSLRELVGHTKGVVAMSWCPIDSSYLLTRAKDNHTICWDTYLAEIPGVTSTSLFDGKIGIYIIEACARYGVGKSYLVSAPSKAPKRYQRKAGVTFGFGGKLVTFYSTRSSSGRSEVNLRDLATELRFVTTSSEFEAALKSGDLSSLRLLCEQKYQESESEEERETSGFLKVMFEDDGTARTKLLNHLGFTPLPPKVNETTEDNLSHDLSSLNVKENEVLQEGFLGDNREEFFNNLPSPKTETPVSTSVNNFGSEELIKESESLEGITDVSSFDDAVQRALVVGDYKGAVAQCIAANKMADALVIAQVVGASLWETTHDQYLRKNSSPYLKVVAAMVNSDLVSLVNTRPLKSWKETLPLLCTFAQREDWTLLCDTLASRLLAAGNTLAATLCYICAGNIDKTVEIWSKNVTSEHDGESYVDLFQDLMEKTVILALATGQKRFSASLCKLIEKYAEILASQELLTTAMEYLKLMGTEDISPELSILRDWISLSSEPEKEEGIYGFCQLTATNNISFNQQNSVVEPS